MIGCHKEDASVIRCVMGHRWEVGALGIWRRRGLGGRYRGGFGYRRHHSFGHVRGLSWRFAALLFLAALITGWYVGRLNALPERPEIVLSVYRHDIGQTVPMELETYVQGVVAAEMPAEFHPEALKAQSIAARTLALRLWQAQEPLAGHPDAIISTNPGVHQAWLSDEDLRERWGPLSFFSRKSKVARAVTETRGLVITFDGELIFPAYHASSGGRTESSENYWTSYLPYLRSVDDPYVTGSRYEKTEAEFSPADVSQKTGVAVAATSTSPLVEVLSRYPSGRVEWAQVGEARMTGRQLREKLQLRSSWFDVREESGRVVFDVFGYGHGVGMSQYGADGMARNGFRFDQILSHYYTGVEIVAWYE